MYDPYSILFEPMDTLEALTRAKHLYTDQINQLKTKIEVIDDIIKDLRLPGHAASTVPSNDVAAIAGKYANVRLTDAILDVVNQYGDPPGLFTPQIVLHLKAGQVKSNAKDFYASVYAVAKSLVDDKKIAQGQRDGKRSFMRKT